jgi:hypothetical protein
MEAHLIYTSKEKTKDDRRAMMGEVIEELQPDNYGEGRKWITC